MSPLLGAILLYLIAMVVFLLGTVWFVRAAVNHTIGRKHRILEHIMETGSLPEIWTDGAMAPGKTDKKVRKLAAYVRKTRLVDSEDTRTLLLSRLEQARTVGKE